MICDSENYTKSIHLCMVAMGWSDKNHFSSKNKSGYTAFIELMRFNFFNYTSGVTIKTDSHYNTDS